MVCGDLNLLLRDPLLEAETRSSPQSRSPSFWPSHWGKRTGSRCPYTIWFSTHWGRQAEQGDVNSFTAGEQVLLQILLSSPGEDQGGVRLNLWLVTPGARHGLDVAGHFLVVTGHVQGLCRDTKLLGLNCWSLVTSEIPQRSRLKPWSFTEPTHSVHVWAAS